MSKKILYIGDTSLSTAASYMAGVLAHSKIEFDYVESAKALPVGILKENYAAMILSDYPAANISDEQFGEIDNRVSAGMGLLMVGGWESFVGSSGNYHRTSLYDLLPVAMQSRDDRVNWAGPCIIEKNTDHTMLSGLEFEEELPIICGFNNVKAKPNSVVVLSARRFNVYKSGNNYTFSPLDPAPLLVAGSYGKGRTAAFTSDFAPHWSGSLVDWGGKRFALQAKGAEAVEVGEKYIRLVANITRWIGNL